MGKLTDPMFVLAALAIIAVTVLAGLRLIEGNTAAAGILGLAGGAWANKGGAK